MAMVPTPNRPSKYHWTSVAIYTGHRLEPKWVELVAVEDDEFVTKGDTIETGVAEFVSGDALLPTRQRNAEAVVYSITLAPATNDDKNFLIASGIRQTLVDDMVWVVV